MDVYKQLAENPEVENCFPKFIAKIDGKNVVLANAVDGAVYLTDEGKKFLATPEDEAPVVEKPVEKATRARKAKVEPVAEQPIVIQDTEIGELDPNLNFDE